jgi:hypothetical protein
MQKFSIPSYTANDLAKSTYRSLEVNVDGFWNNPITISVERKNDYGINDNDIGVWTTSLSTSSGGTESKYDNLEAYSNFAEAILASVQVCKDINSMSDAIEADYQKNVAKWEEESEKNKAEVQAKIDADPAIGEVLATVYVENAIKLAKAKSTSYRVGESSIDAYARGSETNKTIFTVTFGSRAVFRTGSNRTGLVAKKADVIKKLAEYSIRSMV